MTLGTLRNLQSCLVYGLVVCFVCVITPSLGNAREPDLVINLWPAMPPGESQQVGAEQNMSKPTDRQVAGRPVIRIGNVAVPQAHVYLAPQDQRNGTAMVICPGGGFNILAWDLEGTEVAEWLNTMGVTGIVLKYRVPTRNRKPPVWEAPVQDAQRALSLARHRSTEWGINTERLGILGFSAGGQTAGMAAIKNGERIYSATDDIDKASCRPEFAVLIYPWGMVDTATGQLREDIRLTKDHPPMFLAHAQDDGVIPENSVMLFLALKKAGVPAELHVYDAGGHGYGLRPVADFPVTSWNVRCAEWMKRRALLKTGLTE